MPSESKQLETREGKRTTNFRVEQKERERENQLIWWVEGRVTLTLLTHVRCKRGKKLLLYPLSFIVFV